LQVTTTAFIFRTSKEIQNVIYLLTSLLQTDMETARFESHQGPIVVFFSTSYPGIFSTVRSIYKKNHGLFIPFVSQINTHSRLTREKPRPIGRKRSSPRSNSGLKTNLIVRLQNTFLKTPTRSALTQQQHNDVPGGLQVVLDRELNTTC